MNPIVPAVVIGGAVYVLQKDDGPVGSPGPTQYMKPGLNGYGYDPYLDDGGQAGFGSGSYGPAGGRPTDPNVNSKLDLLKQAAEKAYNKMSTTAKVVAAQEMNERLNLNPPLKGNETWATVARVAGGAAGAAACNAIPGVGTAVSPLCAIAGSYLGVKLEDWISNGLGELEDFVSKGIGNVVGSIGDAIGDTIGSIGGWINDIF